MNLKKAASLALFAAILSLGQQARAEAPRSRNRQQPRVSSTSVRDRLGDTRYRLVDGKFVPVSGSTGGGGSRDDGGSTPPEEPAPSPTLPFDHFDADNDGSSIINSYFLAYLSMLMYSGATNVDDFEDELRDELLPQGVVDVRAFMNSSGVEGAIVTTSDAAIVVFRGTSSIGSEAQFADYFTDANHKAKLVNVGGDWMYVHEGFWDAADSIFPVMLEEMAAEYLGGREVWVTGHSLGAAIATLTALRLHYDEGITVHGLQTVGSPRAGDADMVAKCQSFGSAGWSLESRTVRWVVDGDPVTTFFFGDIIGWNFVWPIWVYYEHVGTTHTIVRRENGGYEVEYDTGEDLDMSWNIAGLNLQHMWYLEALTCEMTLVLMEEDQLDVLKEIIETP
ncbi:MAG: lipase family protein [Planctomycetes bacterium]|nr:lipase family protein [Planctomycetota bacterium]